MGSTFWTEHRKVILHIVQKIYVLLSTAEVVGVFNGATTAHYWCCQLIV